MSASNMPHRLALACVLSGAAAAQAQSLPALGEVVVTATRTRSYKSNPKRRQVER